MSEAEVTQADRIAAVSGVLGDNPLEVGGVVLDWAASGMATDLLTFDGLLHDTLVERAERFARHRAASTAPLLALLRAIVAGFDRAESINGMTLLEVIRSDHGDGVPHDASEHDLETERVIGAMADAVDAARKVVQP